MVQDKNWPPTAGAGKIQRHSGEFDGRFGPPGTRRHHDTSRRGCLRLSPRPTLLQPPRDTSELQNPAHRPRSHPPRQDHRGAISKLEPIHIPDRAETLWASAPLTECAQMPSITVIAARASRFYNPVFGSLRFVSALTYLGDDGRASGDWSDPNWQGALSARPPKRPFALTAGFNLRGKV